MKKEFLKKIYAFVLAASMLASLFACTANQGNDETQAVPTQSTSEEGSGQVESSAESTVNAETGAESTEHSDTESTEQSETAVESRDESTVIGEETTESDAASESTSEEESVVEETLPGLIDGEYASLIENSALLKNGVQAYFADSSREHFLVENSQMKLSYALSSETMQRIDYIANSKGVSYVENTMDVYIKMENGNVFYASGSSEDVVPNIYRLGMYYYDVRLSGQNFFNDPETIIGDPYENWTVNTNRSNNVTINDDGTVTIANVSDPYIIIDDFSFSSVEYNLLKVKLRAIKGTRGSCRMFVKMGGSTGFMAEQSVTFNFPNTGEYYEIIIPLYKIPGCKGELTGLRFDIDGNEGDVFEIVEIAPSRLDFAESVPMYVGMSRAFSVYSDKMHQCIQLATERNTASVASVGIITEIDESRVAKLIVKDKNGLHESLDGVDWASAEYVGFDIKDVGIFGYILPKHESAGALSVTLSEGKYTIDQSKVPEKNALKVSREGKGNQNDLYISHRLYTDENHSFKSFIREAEIERNPIDDLIVVTPHDKNASSYLGYDPIIGAYKVNIESTGGFGQPFYIEQNRAFIADITVNSNDDRDIYVMAVNDKGYLECSVVLSKDNVLLPIPVEVCKNFSEDKDKNLFNIDDATYSEAIVPITLKAGDSYRFKIANIYQNWGKYPLKQISSIQFLSPYYHLSTGVTESNCIVTLAQCGPALPDFRAMSAPLWSYQPQRNSGGHHAWFEYTDADGNYSSTENYADYIDSYGPTYADVTMQNITYDGKMKVTYVHTEMPQTDENRTYYEIKIEVLEDIDFADFKHNFMLYSVTDNEPAAYADYRQLGYLDVNNQCVITEANLEHGTEKEYILGDECPYFTLFDMPATASPDGYTNVACLIYNSEIVIGGEARDDVNYVVLNTYNTAKLSLDLDEVHLKAGDSFTINAILMPWGSHESDYTYGDVNVRAVRENTLLNPLKVTSDTDDVIESVYVPKVRSRDGESATFTLSGGYNNIAVRVYGFKKLTVPTLYQLVGGEWTKIELSSSDYIDSTGYYNYFDGYMVHYDGDGTYSYSFVTNMDGENDKIFKLDAGEIVSSLPESGQTAPPDYLDLYYDPGEIRTTISSSSISSPQFSKVEFSEDRSYVSLYANNAPESFFIVGPKEGSPSGKHIVVKYRIPTTNKGALTNFEFFLSSTGGGPVSGDNFRYLNVKRDGEWHVLVIDVSTYNHPTFKPNADGVYDITYLRFDVINNASIPATDRIDLAFVGMCDTVEEVCDLVKSDMKVIEFVSGGEEILLDTETLQPVVKTFIDPESGYTESDLPYWGVIDSVGGVRLGVVGNSATGISEMKFSDDAIPAVSQVSGWVTVEGGLSQLVWSADGGLTWNAAVDTKYYAASDDIINHAQNKLSSAIGRSFAFADRQATKTNGAFQSPRAYFDFSEYAGLSVDLIIAAVPIRDQSTLCLIACLEGVTIQN